jgi:hypothetical protein
MAIMSEYNTRVNILTEQLFDTAGQNPAKDAERAGAIKAYRDVLNITYSEIEESR